MAQHFDPELFESERRAAGATWGRPVRFLASTESTNDLALDAIESDAKTGIVWLALEQRRGRGRRGSVWRARPGESLLMSVLVRWPSTRNLVGVSLASGLAVRATCELLLEQCPFQLKWPNDVLAGDRKLAGVLVEARTKGEREAGVVIGIGLNLLTEDFDPSWGSPTSLRVLGARPEDLGLERVLALLLRELEKRISELVTRGPVALCQEARKYDALLGRHVRIRRDEEILRGKAVGWTDRGGLLLETQGGLLELDSGHVEAF